MQICLGQASHVRTYPLRDHWEGFTLHAAVFVWEWLRILDEMIEQPKILVLENVTGLLSTNNGENYSVLHHALTERNYKCGAIVINASHFVPQSRPRVFIIAVKKAAKYPII